MGAGPVDARLMDAGVPGRGEQLAGRPLRLATRGSPLALFQARLVAGLLARAHPGIQVEEVVVRTQGDRRADVSLDRIGGQGVFVREVQEAVLSGRAHAAVHSAKDLPAVTQEGLILAAVPERADPRDGLAGLPLDRLPPGAVVATGSARRRAQLAWLRPDLTFVDLRGNMATRARRARDGSVHAVVVAVAAFDRLGWADQLAQALPTRAVLPQVGQGALAVECRADDSATARLLAALDHPDAHRTVAAERAFLAAVGGDCSVPVGAWARPAGDGLRLEGMVASGDGRVLVRAALEGDRPAALGADLARHLLTGCGGAAVWGPR